MRALPLRVWKARRTLVMAPASSCLDCSCASDSRAFCSTSRASSRKISRISGSSSRPLDTGAGVGAGAAAGDTGAGSGGRLAASVLIGCVSSAASPGLGRRCVTSSADRSPGRVASSSAGSRRSVGWCAVSSSSDSIGRPWLPVAVDASVSPLAGAAPRCVARACLTMRSNSSVTASASVSGWPALSSGARESNSSKPVGRSSRAITADRLPATGSKRNSDLAICGCTLTMSIRKLSAPRLSARRSKVPVSMACCGLTSVLASASTSSRMRSTACEAWSRPSTDSTPRIAESCAGTGISTSRCAGSRKYWSMFFSTSDNEARSSCTTLPMVWRSDTRRYSSSIHSSSVPGSRAWRTESMRWARRWMRWAPSGWSKSPSSIEASRYSSAVATSIASSAGGSPAAATVCAAATCSARPSTAPSGYRRASESLTSANCSGRPGRRAVSPPATADHTSLAAATRLRACATQAGSKRPSRACS